MLVMPSVNLVIFKLARNLSPFRLDGKSEGLGRVVERVVIECQVDIS